MSDKPKLSRETLKKLRLHKSRTTWKFSLSGRKKNIPPISLRLPPEKR